MVNKKKWSNFVKKINLSMNNPKEFFETIVENQNKAMHNFVETANKFQEAIKSENTIEKSTELYKNWWDTQLSFLNNTTSENKVEDMMKDSATKTEDFFKNMQQTQMDAIKKATEFNLNILNTISNFTKSGTETTNQFSEMNSTWNTLFDSWNKTLNSTMDSLNKSMTGTYNSDLFKNALNTNNFYFKLQEFYKPYFNKFTNEGFTVDTMKSMFDANTYKKVTEDIFHTFFQTNSLYSLLETNTKLIHDFLNTNVNSNNDLQEYWKLVMDKYPHLVSGDYAKFIDTFKSMTTPLTDSFSPMMKLISDSKEKENAELAIATIDKVLEYNTKLMKMQNLLYTTGQKVATESISTFSNHKNSTSFQPFFNEWVTLNEKQYSDLFATNEFSTLKAELIALSLEVKTNLEKQFENRIENLPLVVKSEMNEVYKTIHDLKKTIKTLENKISTFEKTTEKGTEKTVAKKTTTA